MADGSDKADDITPSSKPSGVQAIVHGIASFNVEDYDLVFQVFMGSDNLNDAMRMTEAAVCQRPDLKIWTECAAQMTEWNRQLMAASNYWLTCAQLIGDDAAWQHMSCLASVFNEDHAHLAGLRYRMSRNPSDMRLLDQVIAAYERLGEPVEGLAHPSSIVHGPHRQVMLECYASLAEHAGKDDQAYDTYTRL